MKIRLAIALLVAVSACCASLQKPQSSFISGEVSPLLSGRLEMQQAENGARTLENVVVIDVGAVTRRPGSVYVTSAPGACRLQPFVYNESDAYILEFSDKLLRFYRSAGIILDPNNDPYSIATPYAAADLFELTFYQSADVMYVAHEDYSPRKLTRLAHASWTLEDFNSLVFDGPFRDLNATTTSVQVSDVNDDPSNPSNWVHLIADANIFTAEDAGSLWKIQHVMPSQHDETTFSGVADGNEIVAGIGAAYTFQFTSVAFQGTIKLQVGYDDGGVLTWTDNYVVTNATSGAVDANDSGISDFGQNVLLRVSCTAFTSGTVDYTLDVDSYLHTGLVRIYEYGTPNDVNVSVVDRCGLADTDTTLWAEGAWNDVRGYPSAVTGHFGRLVFAKGMTVWWSAADDYENFRAGINDDDAFTYTISQAQQNPIRWLVGERTQDLIVGSLGKLMELRPLDELVGFTPTNPPKVLSTVAATVGPAEPVLADTSVLFTDRTGRRVNEALYDSTEESLTAPDLTMLASHITGATGVKQMAWQRSPYPILWCARNDGEMATLYYNRPYKIAAWSRQVTDGDYTSVAVVPTSGGNDRVWAVVTRTVNGSTGYYVEYFDDLDIDAQAADAFYVDSGLTWDGGDAVNITAVSKANPGVVTVSSWPVNGAGANLGDGTQVRITGIVGMTQLNDNVYTIHSPNVGAKTFQLRNSADTANINTTSYTTYGSAGTVQGVENTFAGLEHLEGEDVAVLADGVYVEGQTVGAVVSVVKTVDINALDPTDDYQLDNSVGQANANEQVVTLTSILPAHATLLTAQARCLETVSASAALQIEMGTTSSGNDIFAFTHVDSINDSAAAGASPVLSATGAARSLYATFKPDSAFWNALDQGRWSITLTYEVNAVALDDYCNQVAVGLPYTSTVTPLEVDLMVQGGTTQFAFKRITRLLLNVYKTSGVKYGVSADALKAVPWPASRGNVLADPATQHTGAFIVPVMTGSNQEATYTIVQDEPYPMILRSVVPLFEVGQ